MGSTTRYKTLDGCVFIVLSIADIRQEMHCSPQYYKSTIGSHSEEHHPQMEEVLTCLLTDLSAEERRIRRGQCAFESRLVCPCIEVLPVSESDCSMLGLVVVASNTLGNSHLKRPHSHAL